MMFYVLVAAVLMGLVQPSYWIRDYSPLGAFDVCIRVDSSNPRDVDLVVFEEGVPHIMEGLWPLTLLGDPDDRILFVVASQKQMPRLEDSLLILVLSEDAVRRSIQSGTPMRDDPKVTRIHTQLWPGLRLPPAVNPVSNELFLLASMEALDGQETEFQMRFDHYEYKVVDDSVEIRKTGDVVLFERTGRPDPSLVHPIEDGLAVGSVVLSDKRNPRKPVEQDAGYVVHFRSRSAARLEETRLPDDSVRQFDSRFPWGLQIDCVWPVSAQLNGRWVFRSFVHMSDGSFSCKFGMAPFSNFHDGLVSSIEKAERIVPCALPHREGVLFYRDGQLWIWDGVDAPRAVATTPFKDVSGLRVFEIDGRWRVWLKTIESGSLEFVNIEVVE